MITTTQAASALIQLTVCCAGLASAQSLVDTIKIDEGRPLGMAVVQLNERYRYMVTYEDVPPDLDSEVLTTVHPPNAFHADEVHARAPKTGPVTFRVTRPSKMKPGEPDVALVVHAEVASAAEDLVTQYNASGNPGQFKVIDDGKYVHVVPFERKVRGKIRPFEPVFDTRVTITPDEESKMPCMQALNNLFFKTYEARNISVVLGMVSMNSLFSTECQVSGANVKAREVLKSILEQMTVYGLDPRNRPTDSFAWSLVYDVNFDAYFFSTVLIPLRDPLVGLPSASPAPKGTKAPGSRIFVPPEKQDH